MVQGCPWDTCKTNLEVGPTSNTWVADLMACTVDETGSMLGTLLKCASCTCGIKGLACHGWSIESLEASNPQFHEESNRKNIKVLRTDRNRNLMVLDTQQQNVVVERWSYFTWVIRWLMEQINFPIKFWGCYLTAAYILTWVLFKSITYTLYELWTTVKSNWIIGPLRCSCYVHNIFHKHGKLGLGVKKCDFIMFHKCSEVYVMSTEHRDGGMTPIEPNWCWFSGKWFSEHGWD